jgi:hypothetical protein
VRAIRPRFAFHTGHVTVGGSICIELLTSSGWCAARPRAPALARPRVGGGATPRAHPHPQPSPAMQSQIGRQAGRQAGGRQTYLAVRVWRRSPAYTLESLLVQLRSLFVAGEARLDPSQPDRAYNEQEARDAFRRVAMQHGWKV